MFIMVVDILRRLMVLNHGPLEGEFCCFVVNIDWVGLEIIFVSCK